MTQNWFEFKNEATSDTADIWIYSEVGSYDTNASKFISELQDVKDKNLNVHINSLGGDVFDGLAIYNALKNHTKNVTIKIEGIAASIASVIAMAGDNVEMAENSLYMIHNPFVMAGGDATELRKTASILDKIRDEIANIYSTKSSLDLETLVGLMEAETWFNANEANDLGFANGITQPLKIENNYNISKFSNITHDKINSILNINKSEIMAKDNLKTNEVKEEKNLLSQIKELFVNQAPEIKNDHEEGHDESEAEKTDWAKTYEEMKDRVENLEDAVHRIEEAMGMKEEEMNEAKQEIQDKVEEIKALTDENSKLKAGKTDVVAKADPSVVEVEKSASPNMAFFNAMAETLKKKA
jgi:ATP-dependent protease ClpP protease subunit/regulator of replication initiation timing